MKNRYTLHNLVYALRNPSIIRGELNDLSWRINAKIHALTETEGIYIMEEDWDTFIILDGCRYDTFEKTNTLPGTLETRRSYGSQSWEFFKANFLNNKFHDTIFVSANPYTVRLPKETFYKTYHLWDTEWNDNYDTVLPEDVTKQAIRVHRSYPNKRLLVHYMQPHFPFIGPTGKQLSHQGIRRLDKESKINTALDLNKYPVWLNLRYKLTDIDLKTVKQAYQENLDIVLDTVPELVNNIDGKTIISSDHGNLLGERLWPLPVRGFGHPPGLRSKPLIQVPWFTHEHDSRREIKTTDSMRETNPEDSIAKDRLEKLGYR